MSILIIAQKVRGLSRAGGGQNNIKTHFQVFSGSSHSDLTNKVCDRLGIEPGKVGSWQLKGETMDHV